jgi:dihydroneopterin triphosphate diphosphatase
LPHKIPVSALIVVYTRDLLVLLLERADFPDHWQSVTGSQEAGESLRATATRELAEETGIAADAWGGLDDWRASREFEIYAQWSHRYPPGTTHNTEHWFGLAVPAPVPVRLAPGEHLRHTWLPWREAAQRCFSWTNRDAILELPQRSAGPRRTT